MPLIFNSGGVKRPATLTEIESVTGLDRDIAYAILAINSETGEGSGQIETPTGTYETVSDAESEMMDRRRR